MKYQLFIPSGNPTALVEDEGFLAKERLFINEKIMKSDSSIEQVGFVDSNFRLVMAGGERCINAIRCAGLFYMDKFNLDEVNVKNLDEVFKCGKDKFGIFVASKFSDKFSVKKLSKFEYLVSLDGITHLVNLEKLEFKSDDEYKKFGFEKIKSLNLNTLRASGFINIFEDFLKPVVFVRDINTLFYESACASGSLAACVVLNLIGKKSEFRLTQPSNKELFVEIYKEFERFIGFKISGEILKV